MDVKHHVYLLILLSAHSRCEQQRALFTDMMKISKSQLTVPLVTQAQLSSMMTRIMAKIEAKALPLTNCSADGGFTPVQCQVAVGGGEETCWCVCLHVCVFICLAWGLHQVTVYMSSWLAQHTSVFLAWLFVAWLFVAWVFLAYLFLT